MSPTHRHAALLLALALSLSTACGALAPDPAQSYRSRGRAGPRVFGYTTAYDAYESTANVGTAFTREGDVELDAWGAEIELGRTQVFGLQRRQYDDPAAESDMLYLGYFDYVSQGVYLMGAATYDLGLEFQDGTETGGIWGWGLGGGLRIELGGGFSIEYRMLWESFFERASVGGEEFKLEGWVGTLGVGFEL